MHWTVKLLDLASQVKLFVMQFKSYAKMNSISTVQINRKTSMFLRELGWTSSYMLEYILNNLCEENFYRGPSDHHFINNTKVMEFGITLNGQELYVKISLSEENGACMSFHPCESEIEYPLRKRC